MYETQVTLLTNTLNTIKESIDNYKNNMEKEFEAIATKTKDTTVSSLEGAHLIQEIRANLRALHLKFVEYIKKLKSKLEADETYKERINYRNINLGLIFSKISYWSKINDLLHKGIIYNINFKENLDNLKNDLESINLKIPTDIKVDSFINGKVKYNGESIEQILDRTGISRNQTSLDTKTLVNEIDNVMNMNTIKINQSIETFYKNLITDLKESAELESELTEAKLPEPEPDYDDEDVVFYDEPPPLIDVDSINYKLKEILDEMKLLQDNSSFNSKLNIISETLSTINDKLQISDSRDEKLDKHLQDITNLNSIMLNTNSYITTLEKRLAELEKSTHLNTDEQRAILMNLVGDFNQSLEQLKSSSINAYKLINGEILNEISKVSNENLSQFENIAYDINNLLQKANKYSMKNEYKELINELKEYITKLTNVDEIYNYITSLISNEVIEKLDLEHSKAFQQSIVDVINHIEQYKTAALNETRTILKEKDDRIVNLLKEKRKDEKEKVKIIKDYSDKMFKYIKDIIDKNTETTQELKAQGESNLHEMVAKLESYNQNINTQINKVLSRTGKSNADIKKLVDDYKDTFTKKTQELLNYIKDNEKNTFEKLNAIEDLSRLTAYKQRILSKELNTDVVQYPGIQKRRRHL